MALLGLFLLAPLFATVVATLVAVLLSWPVMLVLGVVHSEVFTWVPPLGLSQTFWVLLLLAFVGSLFGSSPTIKD